MGTVRLPVPAVGAGVVAGVAAVVVTAVLAAAARADVDLEVANGARVKGSLDPGDQAESLRVRVPAGARITAKTQGSRGARGRLTLAASDGTPVASGTVNRAGTGATLKSTVAATDQFAVRTTSDGAAPGNYVTTVTWAPALRFAADVPVAPAAESVHAFSADGGSVVTVTARAASGSAAAPRIVRITGPGAFEAAVGTGGTARVTSGPVRLPVTGDYVVVLSSDAAAGDLAVSVKVRAPRVRRAKIDISTVALGSSNGELAFGAVLGAGGGLVEIPSNGQNPDPFDVAGSSVNVLPGALPYATTIVVGSAPPLDPNGPYAPIGATVSYAPDGQKFVADGAVVTIPLDVSLAGGDLSNVRVYSESGGVVRVVPGPYDFSVEGYVSFPVQHFTRYVATSDFVSEGGLSSIAMNLNPPGDLALASGYGPVPRFLYYVFQGNTVLDFVAAGDGGFDPSTFAGGGATTTEPVARTDFSFPAEPTCVAASGQYVYIGIGTAVYRVDLATDLLSRFAGTLAPGDAGDAGPATSATFRDIRDLSVGADGAVYVADAGAARIRRIGPDDMIDAWAGDGVAAVGADGVAATASHVLAATAPVEDRSTGILYFADGTRVRAVGTDGIVSTRSGGTSFTGCTAGTTGPVHGRFRSLTSIAITSANFRATGARRVYVTDTDCHAVYAIHVGDGTTTDVIGTPGTAGFTADGGSTGPVSQPQTVLTLGATGVVFFDRFPTPTLAGIRTLVFGE